MVQHAGTEACPCPHIAHRYMYIIRTQLTSNYYYIMNALLNTYLDKAIKYLDKRFTAQF